MDVDMMDQESFERMFQSVFAPKPGERVVLLYDLPTDTIADNIGWKDRRDLVDTWCSMISTLSKKEGFSVETLGVAATGRMNASLPKTVLEKIQHFHILIAMSEFSMTSSLVSLVYDHNDCMRCASMPLVERRMMETVFAMDYSDVNRYAHRIKTLLEDAANARVEFSTGDRLTMDLRGRHAGADDGDCTYPGACINLPSGEGFIAPYEAVGEEQNTFGVSRTEGTLPLSVENEILGCVVNKNRIGEIKGPESLVSKMKAYFDQSANRRNIAELGIGCNPQAKVSGNIIEDEKAGVHIAYGTSHHLGGKITSDLHQDIIFAKGCPVTADSVIFFFEESEPMELVKDAQVQYHLLK